MDSLLKADDKKLNEYLLLSNGKFNIPYTQRPYEWSNSQVERLFNDIIAIHQGDKEQHILNFITIYLEDDHQNIYDGQQRTVTLLLFICAIIDKISKMGDVSIANKLKEEFIKKMIGDIIQRIIPKSFSTKMRQMNFSKVILLIIKKT